MTMSKIEKVAVVTGGSQGIGAGIVHAYRNLGYAVIANSRDTKQGSDGDVIAVAGPIGDRGMATRVVDTALERFGRIDTLINNAGIFISKPFTDFTANDFRDVLDFNLAGFFHVTQLALP